MRLALAAGALAALVALAPLAASGHECDDYQDVYVGMGPDGANIAYVTFSCFGCEIGPWSIWLYLESNGVQGFQRGGVTLLGDADICQAYPIGHDQGIF